MSLFDTTELQAMTLASYCYQGMYSDCRSLTGVTNLPAEKVFKYSYDHMFANCTTLSDAQSILPATYLAEYCYQYMFYGCDKLRKCPELPAKLLFEYCYAHMFEWCRYALETLDDSYLSAAQNEDLAEYCYSYMFAHCLSLAVPMKALPSVVFKKYCYEYMFMDCPRLKRTPIIGTKQMIEGCFQYMFSGDTTLVSEEVYLNINDHGYAPKFCCRGTFAACVNLKSTIRMTVFNTNIEERCFAEMYSGCTILNDVSRVRFATVLAEGCYEDMFAYTDVEKPNELPAETGVLNCYRRMFYKCSRLLRVGVNLLRPSSNYTEDWVVAVSNSGTFLKNSSVQSADWTALGTSDGVPSGWAINDL